MLDSLGISYLFGLIRPFRFDLLFKFGLLIFGLKQTPPNPNPRHIDFVADKPSLDDVHFQIRVFRSIKQGL